jgi:cell division protein FtsW (lipid II flippase)
MQRDLRPLGTSPVHQVETMSTKPARLNPFAIEGPASDISIGLRTLAILLRALFIGAVMAITVRVSSPQSETLSSVYETPEDFVRLILGFAVCLWIVLHLFTLPRTAEGYRTWVYLGLLVAPLACAAAILIWR